MIPINLVDIKALLRRDELDIYAAEPIPSLRDKKVMELTAYYIRATQDQRLDIIDCFNAEQSFGLLTFAVRMAEWAIRSDSIEPVRMGLLAITIENARWDPRENLPVLSLLYHSANKLNKEPCQLFNSIGRISEVNIRDMLADYVARTEHSIESMGYSEVGSGAEFKYSRNW